MGKRGTSLSLEIIIIAVILLIVLIVVIAIFGGSIKNWMSGTKRCESQGGVCSPSDTECTVIPDADCSHRQNEPICCLVVPGLT